MVEINISSSSVETWARARARPNLKRRYEDVAS